jgi:superfamily II DNA helicase RecQ
MEVSIRSCINDAMGASLAIQARRYPTSPPSQLSQRESFVPHPSLLKMLRVFLRNPSATFKTPQQAEALEIGMAGDQHLLLVGPTAMGKSLVYMLPAAQRNHGITCVLLPLSALHLDFDRRCRDLNIESSRWLPGTNERPRTRIVYISPEHAQTSTFINYLVSTFHLGLLVQLVIDEVHLVKLHSDFRFCFSALKQLVVSSEDSSFRIHAVLYGLTISSGVPFLLLTATCPPSLRSELLDSLGITDCHVIHAPTDRPEISYNVKVFATLDGARDSLVEAVLQQIEEKKAEAPFRGLVYCRSKVQVEELAALIGCQPFHAGRTTEERSASFKDWVGGKQMFMVCSSLFGCGVDVEAVGIVFHFGTPWSILDFVQESGRAGWEGHPSVSMVFASNDEREPDGEVDLYGKHTMRQWVLQTSLCRRIALSSFLDGGHITCMLLKGAILCDVCRVNSNEPHPKKLVAFPTLETPHGDVSKLKLSHVPPTSVQYETDRGQAVLQM